MPIKMEETIKEIGKLKNKKIIFVLCDPDAPTLTPNCELIFNDETGLHIDFGADFPAVHLLKKGESYLKEEIERKIKDKEEEIKDLKGVLGIE